VLSPGPTARLVAPAVGFHLNWKRLADEHRGVDTVVANVLKAALDRVFEANVPELKEKEGKAIEDVAAERNLAHLLRGEFLRTRKDGKVLSIMLDHLVWQPPADANAKGTWAKRDPLWMEVGVDDEPSQIASAARTTAFDFRTKVRGTRIITVSCFFPMTDIKTALDPVPALPAVLPTDLPPPLTRELGKHGYRADNLPPAVLQARCAKPSAIGEPLIPAAWSGDILVEGLIRWSDGKTFDIVPHFLPQGGRPVPVHGFTKPFAPNSAGAVVDELAVHIRKKWPEIEQALR
jgi:hypothetical protein